MHVTPRRILSVLAATVVLATGCAAPPSEPVTAAEVEGEAPPSAPAESIVSLSPTSTEILFAIGAGDQVAAADQYSTYPADAPATSMSGYDPNVESILATDPDLVVVAADTNDVVAGLEAVDVPVVVHPAATSLDDVTDQIEALGRLTGHASEADELATSISTRLDELADAVPAGAGELTYYHEISPTHHTATSSTFIGQLYGLLGLTNIADAAPAAGQAGGYPQLSPEYIVEADPDLVFLTHEPEPGQAPAERPGWGQVAAVRHDAVITLDADVSSRWGPRVVQHVETVLEAVEERLGSAPA